MRYKTGRSERNPLVLVPKVSEVPKNLVVLEAQEGMKYKIVCTERYPLMLTPSHTQGIRGVRGTQDVRGARRYVIHTHSQGVKGTGGAIGDRDTRGYEM